MFQDSELWRRRENGTVEITEIPRGEWPASPTNSLVEKKFIYRWRPPYALSLHLPGWYDLSLACDLYKDGNRIFSPVGKAFAESQSASPGLKHVAETPGLSLVTSLGGHAILNDRDELEQDLPLNYREARLFLQYARHMQEHLGETVKLGEAISVCAGAKPTRSMKNILPEDIGLDPKGNGTPWHLGRVRGEGILGAILAGIENPTPDQVLWHGLHAAAKLNPLRLLRKEAASVVRMTLFALGPASTKVSGKDIRYVAKHVRNSLRDHLDDSTEKFDLWLEDPKANLINRISKRKDCKLVPKEEPKDGVMPDEKEEKKRNRLHVRSVLLELGWQSIESLGRCIHKQMETFKSALPDPLTDTEAALFDSIYLSHPACGGLPLLLLCDRFDFLRRSILETWDRPNDKHAIAVLHRMMYYYAYLIGNRRGCDSLYKRRAKTKTKDGGVAREEDLKDNVEKKENSDRTRELMKETVRRLKLDIPNLDVGGDEWDAKLVGQSDGEVEIFICIPKHELKKSYFVPAAKFRPVAQEVQTEMDDEERLKNQPERENKKPDPYEDDSWS